MPRRRTFWICSARLDRPDVAAIAPAARRRHLVPIEFSFAARAERAWHLVGVVRHRVARDDAARARFRLARHRPARVLTGRVPDRGVRVSASTRLRRRACVERRIDRSAGHDVERQHRDHSEGRPSFSVAATSTRTSRRTACSRAESVFTTMGAVVTRRLYAGMGHLVNDDEVAFVRDVLDGASARER